MNNKKVLHVTNSMDPKLGGVSQAVRTMIMGLEEQNINNEVVSLDTPNSHYLQNGFKVHALDSGKGPWSYNQFLVPWLKKNILRFDSIIIHGLWQYHGYAVRQVTHEFRSLGKSNNQHLSKFPKIFVMPHGMLDPYFQTAPDRKLKALRNWIYWKLIESKIIHEADGILFTCEEECRLAQKTFYPYHPKEEHIIGLGVEEPPCCSPEMYKAFLKQCPELCGQTYILFLSRIHEKKGVDLLIKAYSSLVMTSLQSTSDSLKAKNPNSTSNLPKLVIAGPGLDTPYGQQMQQLVSNSSELQTSIFFTGMLTGESKWGAFYGCDAFILPSHQENFGIAVVEAQACGKPVLISNQINIWKDIESAEGGLVASNSVEGTIQLLEIWKNLPEEKKILMGQSARKSYENKFSVRAAANSLISALSI